MATTGCIDIEQHFEYQTEKTMDELGLLEYLNPALLH